MSISRHIDAYLADRGIAESDEVIPESECQEFSGAVVTDSLHLERVRALVADLMEGTVTPE